MTTERDELCRYAVAMHADGLRPSQILQALMQRNQDLSTGELMDILQRAFSLSLEDVSCLGGWWYDGSGELTDQAIDRLLAPRLGEGRTAR